MSGGLLIPHLGERPLRGPNRIVDRLLHLADRGGLAEVVGELGQMALEPSRVGGIEILERLGYAAVESRALRSAQLLVERLANEGVGEAVAAGGRLGEQLRGDRLAERGIETLGVHLG